MTTRYAGLRYNEQCCSLCGTPHYAAEWRGNVKPILVCKECAFHILPALFADATWYPAWKPYNGASDLYRFKSAYWKAQTINVSRRGGAS